ncbi:MAG: zinc ribbon domain-containing protein, partial [Romboutsia sp.]|uniref:zinc ribbon domain-containing protein n=1 Tax=Romboutsia sp. TaxID=1965302 RepID=UPI003F3BA0CE
KNKHLSKAIAEQGMYEFTRQMKYKCEFNNIEFIKADRFYPSSKTCSFCGDINKDLKLKDRTYRCNNCGFKLDRDKNASINLANYKTIKNVIA